MSKTYTGGCKCGRVQIELQIPNPLEDYTARACQCDYCQLNGGVFFSDPEGCATISGQQHLIRETQGSNQADMLLCSGCGSLVGATFVHEGRCLGTVSALIIGNDRWLASATPVSPETLSPEEKADRWSRLWMPVAFR